MQGVMTPLVLLMASLQDTGTVRHHWGELVTLHRFMRASRDLEGARRDEHLLEVAAKLHASLRKMGLLEDPLDYEAGVVRQLLLMHHREAFDPPDPPYIGDIPIRGRRPSVRPLMAAAHRFWWFRYDGRSEESDALKEAEVERALIAMLGDPDPEDRDWAETQLAEYGARALPLLRAYVNNENTERQARVRKLLGLGTQPWRGAR